MKTIKILAFGQVATITGNSFSVNDEVEDTDSLQQLLQQRFPNLQGVKYALAVNKRMITQNQPIEQDATVALLPPFSGG